MPSRIAVGHKVLRPISTIRRAHQRAALGKLEAALEGELPVLGELIGVHVALHGGILRAGL